MKKGKKLLLLVVAATLGLIGLGIYKYKYPKQIHYHAAFQVYKNNQLLDFAKTEFMSLVPCGKETKDFVHLHENVGDIIHVHRIDATWNHVLAYIHETNATDVTLYVDGKPTPLTAPIHNHDRALILIGETTDIEIKLRNVPNEDRIKAAELASELCGTKEK